MKKLAFILELEGSQKLISDLSEVKLSYNKITKELKEAENAINSYNNSSQEQKEALEKTGVTLDSLTANYRRLTAEQADLAETQRRLNGDLRDQQKLFDQTGKKVPTGSLIALRREYRELRKEIDAMDAAARASVDGLEKIKRAEGIKKQINEIGASVKDFREQVGSYVDALGEFFKKTSGSGTGSLGAIIDPLSGLFGSLGGAAGGALGSGAVGGAIGALASFLGPGGILASGGIALLAGSVDYVMDLTKEYEKLNQVVGQLLGLKGFELTNATTQLKTISEIYQIEFNEIARATQAVNLAFGGDVQKTIDLLRTGIAAGADLGNEFLDSAREYPRLIKEAGASQEQFIELLIRSTKEGIYSDKGIDVVKEGNIRLREQTKSTQTALTNAFGKAFTDELLGNINKGATTTFEAMQKISSELSTVDVTASQTGALLADVFGGPGEDAGVEFIKLLKDVSGNLSEVANLTDAYTIRQNNQFEATLELNQAQQELASQFAGMGTTLDTLGTKAKTFAIQFGDELIGTYRAINKTFKDDGFLDGLQALFTGGLSPEALKNRTINRIKDAEALRQVTAGEEKAAKERAERNKRGANGVQGLREEQQKLTQAIQDAKAKGEDYSALLKDYDRVTNLLTKSTQILTTKVNQAKDSLKDSGEIGSVSRLQKEVSILQDKINKSADPSRFTKDLEKKKQELKDAQEKITGYTIEGQQKAAEQEIITKRDTDELLAMTTIENERILQSKLQEIRTAADIEILKSRLTLYKEDSKERIALEQDIAKKQFELSKAKDTTASINKEAILQEVTQLAERAARVISKSEEELQVRLSLVKLNSEKAAIEQKLKSKKLTNEEELKLENELQQKIQEIKNGQGSLVSLSSNQGINDKETRALTELAKEVATLEEYEKKKKDIVLNAELERLELKKRLAIEAGEATTKIEQEIAEKQLEIQDATNAERTERDKAFQEQMLQVQGELLTGLGTLFTEFLTATEKDQKEFSKRALLLVLDTIDKTVTLYIAQIFAKQVAEKSFAGIATAGLLIGLVKGIIGAAKSAISKNEEGGIIEMHKDGTVLRNRFQSHTSDDLTRGAIFKGLLHVSGGEHFRVGNQINEAEVGEAIINRRSTQKFKKILSAINSYNGWGKQFETGAIIGDTPPNLVPTQSFFSGGISDEQMEMFARIVAQKQSEVLGPIVSEVIDRVVQGLDQTARYKDRLNKAQKVA